MVIKNLKRNGWAIVIVQDTSDAPGMIGWLSPDSIIEIKKVKMNTTGELRMNITVKSPFPGDAKFSCFLDLNRTPCELTRVSVRNRNIAKVLGKPRKQLIKELKNWHEKGLKGSEIARKMSLTLSMVKKLKTEAGISKRRQR